MKRRAISGLMAAMLMCTGVMAGGAVNVKADDPTHIVLESLFFGSQPADLAAVEAAINEITIPEINVEVELYPLNFADASSQVSLMISAGDQLDLVVTPTESEFLSLVSKNMLLELDDLYEEYGPDIKESAEAVLGGGYVDNTLYGIPSIEKYGRTFGLMVAKEAVDAVGWDKFEDLTMDELGEFMAKVKEAYPDKTIMQMTGGGANLANFEYFYLTDYLGADAACGAVMGAGLDGNSEIVNVFATEEYKEYCQKMREWYQAGYINQDAATNTDTSQSAVTAGTALGYLLYTELDMVPGQSTANGVDMVALNTRGHYMMQTDVGMQQWCIPYTCEDPEAAMKLLNLMWGNTDLINLIYFGIEGQNYQVLDDGRIDYVEGQNAQTTGYKQWFGLYGDTTKRLTWCDLPADYHDQLLAYNDSIDESNTSAFMGYSFNPQVMKTEYAAVTDVITTYRTALECGSVDPEEVLPQFISALESAGINKIIEENQKELDAWIAENK